jgi:cell wall-associated NlpC family hydrolase
MPSNAPTNAEFVEAARNWMGVRWVHQGRSRMGVDCVGLVLVAACDMGIIIPDLTGYRRTPHPDVFVNHVRQVTIPATQPLPGHIGVFRDGNQPCHVGIFAERHDKPSLIHAYIGTGKVMEEPFIHEWPSKLMEIRAIEGFE